MDLGVGLFLPLSALRTKLFATTSTAICNAFNSFGVFSVNGSIYILVGVNLDRLQAIVRPVSYHQKSQFRTTVTTLLVALLIALLCTAPFWYHRNYPPNCFCTFPSLSDVSFHMQN